MFSTHQHLHYFINKMCSYANHSPFVNLQIGICILSFYDLQVPNLCSTVFKKLKEIRTEPAKM